MASGEQASGCGLSRGGLESKSDGDLLLMICCRSA